MRKKTGSSTSSKGFIAFEDVVRKYSDLYSRGYGRDATPNHSLALSAHPVIQRRGVKSILDVGCGDGRLLHTWEERGYRVAGTEIVPSLLARELKGFGEIYPYSVLDLHKIGTGSFDLVSYVDVLDHLQTKEELSQALLQAVRIARLGVLITVNCVPPSSEQTVKWPRARWEDIISRFFLKGIVDGTDRKGLRFLCWSARHYVRSDDNANTRRESRGSRTVQEASGGDGGQVAEGEGSGSSGESQVSEETTR